MTRRIVAAALASGVALTVVGCSLDWSAVEPEANTTPTPGAAGSSGEAGGAGAGAGGSADDAGDDTGVSDTGAAGAGGAGDDGGFDGGPDGDLDASDGAPTCDDLRGTIYPPNGHCYFQLGGAQSFERARDACAAAGGHLVTISSAAENAFVAKLMSSTQDRWIGYRRAGAPPSEFEWVTGEPSSYTNWGRGRPSEPAEACARIRVMSAQWVDRACTDSSRAICERE